MFRYYEQDQMYLLPPSLKDFIDESHPVHMINDLVEQLDLTILEKRYGSMGQPAYEPRLMLKVILYGFTVGIFSARKLARACMENMAFQYLAGLSQPVFKTFIDFRKRHREDMRAVFVQTAKLARELGLVQLGGVALDGSKIGANTSKHKAMSYGRMQEEERRLKEEIETLLKKADEIDQEEDQKLGKEEDGYSLKAELSRRQTRLEKIEQARMALEKREKQEHPEEPIEPKKQISFADPQARCYAKKGEGTRYVYNAQAAVDMETQVIVENHIEDSVSDAGAVESALVNMEKELGDKPDKLTMDSGYANTKTLESCQTHGVAALCSPSREQKDASDGKTESLDAFSYDEKKDEFQCSHGAVFKLDHWDRNKTEALYCTAEPAACGCGHRHSQIRSHLKVRKSHLAKRAFQRLMIPPENQALYRRRKSTIEPVFGQIKFGMGFHRFLYRGKFKVMSEWNTVCAAFNLKKIAALIKAGRGNLPDLDSFHHLGQAFMESRLRFYDFTSHSIRLFRNLHLLLNGFNVLSQQLV
jgi:transposase